MGRVVWLGRLGRWGVESGVGSGCWVLGSFILSSSSPLGGGSPPPPSFGGGLPSLHICLLLFSGEWPTTTTGEGTTNPNPEKDGPKTQPQEGMANHHTQKNQGQPQPCEGRAQKNKGVRGVGCWLGRVVWVVGVLGCWKCWVGCCVGSGVVLGGGCPPPPPPPSVVVRLHPFPSVVVCPHILCVIVTRRENVTCEVCCSHSPSVAADCCPT